MELVDPMWLPICSDPMYGLIEEIGASKRGGLSNALNRVSISDKHRHDLLGRSQSCCEPLKLFLGGF